MIRSQTPRLGNNSLPQPQKTPKMLIRIGKGSRCAAFTTRQ
jgi:hypothetical protein